MPRPLAIWCNKGEHGFPCRSQPAPGAGAVGGVADAGDPIETVSADLDAAIRGLPTSQLESLGESLLDFTSPEDMEAWMAQQTYA